MKTSTSVVEKKNNKMFFKSFLVLPFANGLLGFTLFFTILFLTKSFSSLIGSIEVFTIDIEDVVLSSIGFILLFLIKFLENFAEKEK